LIFLNNRATTAQNAR
jgi:hypothetical protein